MCPKPGAHVYDDVRTMASQGDRNYNISRRVVRSIKSSKETGPTPNILPLKLYYLYVTANTTSKSVEVTLSLASWNEGLKTIIWHTSYKHILSDVNMNKWMALSRKYQLL